MKGQSNKTLSITIDENCKTCWFIFCFIGLTTLDLRLLEIFLGQVQLHTYSGDPKANHLKTGNSQKPDFCVFENRIFSFSFQMPFKSQKYFRRFLNSIWKPDHLGTNLLLTIQKPDTSGCRILTVFVWPNATKLQFNVWPELSNCHNRPGKV